MEQFAMWTPFIRLVANSATTKNCVFEVSII
jgi:hypothetical protein